MIDNQYLEAYDCIRDINENNDDRDIDDIIIGSSRPYSLSDAQNRLFFMVYNAIKDGMPIVTPSRMGKVSIRVFNYGKKFLKRRVAKKYINNDKVFFSKKLDVKLEDRISDINNYIDELYMFRTDKDYHLDVMTKFYDKIMPDFMDKSDKNYSRT